MLRLDITLHIGTEKTGTSTLQSILSANQDWLAENQVFLPASLRPRGVGDNQIVLPALFCQGSEKSSLRAKAGQQENERDMAFSQRITAAFEREVEQARQQGMQRMLISSEHLSSRLRSSDEIHAMADWLARFGRVSKVLVYLRRQDQFLVSSYSTDLKSGRDRPFNIPGPKWARHRYDYQHLLTLWAEVFGYPALVVRPFERSRFVNQDLIDDFACYAGLQHGQPLREDDKNPSLDPKSMAVLLRYNQWASGKQFVRAERGRRLLVRLLETKSSGKRMCLPAEDAQGFLARYETGNNWVAETFLAGEALFSEPVDTNQSDRMPPEATLDDLFPLLMHSLLNKRRVPNRRPKSTQVETQKSEDSAREDSSLMKKLGGMFR